MSKRVCPMEKTPTNFSKGSRDTVSSSVDSVTLVFVLTGVHDV